MTSPDIWNLSLPSGFELAPAPAPAILVVDDREENLFAMKKLLAKLDAEIITASSGAEALALSLRHRFALVLLDVQMPTMNGFEVAECLRENQDTAHIPIIFITALSKEERYVFQGYDSGAVDYIFKPVDPTILLAKVRGFLDLARQQFQLKRLVLSLTELNERHLRLLESMREGVIGFDLDGTIRFANPMAQRLLEAPNQLVGQPLLRFVAGPDVAAGEWPHHPVYQACLQHAPLDEPDTRLYRANGTAFPAELRFGPFSPEAGPSGGVLVFSDITARKQIEQALRHQATYDTLTDIPNRVLFFDSLGQALARARRVGRALALFFLDLDSFKQANDRYGHASGDALLKAFAQRCKEILREGDLLARLGGDEFAVLVEDTPDSTKLEVLASKLCDETARAFEIDGHLLTVGVSIGIAVCPDGKCDADALLSEADKAMYEAKRQGKGRWCLKVMGGDAPCQTR